MLGSLSLIGASAAVAQMTPIRFQLDWGFEGPSALFLLPKAKNYFEAERLDVAIEGGNGSANSVNRVASGACDIGFADMAALMKFWGDNANLPGKPVAVMMVYSSTPAAVFALKKSGIRSPADLIGRRLGAPVFDAGRKAFPVFAAANSLEQDKITWVGMEPSLRETMLARGDVDAITGFYFTSLLNLNARGVKDADIVILPYPQYGVKHYGNAIIASPKLIQDKPEAVKAFLRAFTKGVKDVINDPDAAVRFVKARDPAIDEALERRRLKLAIQGSIATSDARSEGFGEIHAPRLALMASQVREAFGLKARLDLARIFDSSFLPTRQERNIFAK